MVKYNFTIHFYTSLLLGVCTCFEGYSAADCSIELNSPPTIVGTARDGICDLSVRECAAVAIYGRNFLDSSNITCKIGVDKVTHLSNILILLCVS